MIKSSSSLFTLNVLTTYPITTTIKWVKDQSNNLYEQINASATPDDNAIWEYPSEKPSGSVNVSIESNLLGVKNATRSIPWY